MTVSKIEFRWTIYIINAHMCGYEDRKPYNSCKAVFLHQVKREEEECSVRDG